jgi:transcriptional regulator with XRE-family HTH domain
MDANRKAFTGGVDMGLPDTGGCTAQGSRAGRSSARLVLGARLRGLREAASIGPEEAARAIRGSRSKISRLENGRTGFKQRDVADLLTCYGVSDMAERTTLLELAGHANADCWWQPYADVVPSWLEQYLDMEGVACLIRAYEARHVPGLLQTADYARAILRSGTPGAPEAEVERRAELRLLRQQVLDGTSATCLWVVIDESALRRRIGGAAVMRGQIARLIEASRLPNVRIQVLPLSAGGHAAGGGSVTMLRFHESELPDVVYLEQMLTAVYLSRPEDSAHYREVLNLLAAQAGDLSATTATLERLHDET